MAQEALDQSRRESVCTLADSIDRTQAREIDEMAAIAQKQFGDQ